MKAVDFVIVRTSFALIEALHIFMGSRLQGFSFP